MIDYEMQFRHHHQSARLPPPFVSSPPPRPQLQPMQLLALVVAGIRRQQDHLHLLVAWVVRPMQEQCLLVDLEMVEV